MFVAFWREEKSKKDGSDVLTVGKVGREQNMEQGEMREGSTYGQTS